MSKIVQLAPYLEKKKLIEEVKAVRATLGKSEDSTNYSMMSKSELVSRLQRLQTRHDFDFNFLHLVDLFMRKHYPEYYWRFDIFLDESEK